MTIHYSSKTAEKQFSSKYKAKWRYPEKVKEKLEAAENYILNAGSLQDIANNPSYHFHPLLGTRKGEWSIYLGNTGYRVTMIPCDDEGNAIMEGDIIARCKSIKIVSITEVSNHYE